MSGLLELPIYQWFSPQEANGVASATNSFPPDPEPGEDGPAAVAPRFRMAAVYKDWTPSAAVCVVPVPVAEPPFVLRLSIAPDRGEALFRLRVAPLAWDGVTDLGWVWAERFVAGRQLVDVRLRVLDFGPGIAYMEPGHSYIFELARLPNDPLDTCTGDALLYYAWLRWGDA